MSARMDLLLASTDAPGPWEDAVRTVLPDARLFVEGRDAYDPSAIDYALVWKPAPGLVANLPNLKAVFNLGAGVDALLQDATLPAHLPIVRLVDPRLAAGMTEYVVHWVLHFHRDMHVYARQQAGRVWRQHHNADPAKRRIGFLGYGELARHGARALAMLGFADIAGWSRTPKSGDGVKNYAGEAELDAFLARTDILVNLLPATEATRGLLDARRLDALPRGAFVINAGRGATVVERDLVAALESGNIAACALDVFAAEPLAADSPLWTMENVHVTPHIASLTAPESAVRTVKAGIDAIEAGRTPANVVDRAQGY